MQLRFFHKPVANEIDVSAEYIELVGEGRRHFHFIDLFLDMIEPPEQFFSFLECQAGDQVSLEHQQSSVPPVDTQLDSPSIKRRYNSQSWEQYHDHRYGYHDDTIHQACQPEGKIAIEKTLTRFVVAARIGAYVKFMFQRGWELATMLEQAGFSVYFLRRLKQQIRQRGVQVGPRKELDCGADKRDVMRGNILAEIDGALRQFQLVQVADAACITIGLHEIEKPASRRQQELAHDLRRGGVSHQEHCVNAILEQGLFRVFRVQVQQSSLTAGFDAIGSEQDQGQGPRSAALRSDGEPLAAQLGEQIERPRASIKNKERFV